VQALEGFGRTFARQRAEHDDGANPFRQDHLHCGEPIKPRHVDVHRHDVRLHLDRLLDGVLTVPSSRDQVDVLSLVEKARDHVAHQRGVVRDEYANG
jgi:hypothetical protein